MPLHVASSSAESPSDDWCSFGHDITNSAHIEREFGVTQLQRIKAFQRMTVYGAVAKDVPRDKWKTIPKAMDAVAAEWARLRAQHVWDEDHPRTLGSVQAEAKRNNKTIHIGRLFDLCVEKHSELAAHLRKYKGRVVLWGKHVRDEYGLAAMFPEQGSGASFATASKLLDAVSLLPGCFGEQSDAPSAYTQSVLFEGMDESRCPVTWIQLPPSQWPPSWHKLHKETGQQPVCRLLKCLYGHPMSGLYWEKH